ncbi:MAG: hypothetical protein K2Y22_14155 [Candidatus Obscuribacterales bacterium]|nr:hypothetical protein [Candidatus Obscuribacterales bacterium]
MADGNNIRCKDANCNCGLDTGKPMTSYRRKRPGQGTTPVVKPSLSKTKEEAVETATEQSADSSAGP